MWGKPIPRMYISLTEIFGQNTTVFTPREAATMAATPHQPPEGEETILHSTAAGRGRATVAGLRSAKMVE